MGTGHGWDKEPAFTTDEPGPSVGARDARQPPRVGAAHRLGRRRVAVGPVMNRPGENMLGLAAGFLIVALLLTAWAAGNHWVHQ